MAYTIGEDGLLDFSGCESDDEKLDQYWDYYLEHLNEPEIVAFDGKTVRGFTEWAFDHIVSRSSNKWDTALRHDIEFVERRTRCLRRFSYIIAINNLTESLLKEILMNSKIQILGSLKKPFRY